MKQGVSIIMPCLNEERTVVACIKKAYGFLSDAGLEGEVLIADNGSTDNSVKLARENGARVIHVQEKGYGSALAGGIKAAEFEYVIMGDADDSYDFSSLHGFIEKLNEGYELVMGNRFKGGIEKGAMPFSHRYIGNPLLSGLGRIFFKTNIRDFHCGLRAFRKSSIVRLSLCTTGMEFASEMVVKACLFNLKTTEIPCRLYPDGRNCPPHLRSIPDGMRHLEFLFLYSPKWLFAYPGVLLFLLGALFTIVLYIHPLQIGRIQFEITTMLYAAVSMLVGTQMLSFSIFTKVFATRINQIPKRSPFVNKIENLFLNKGYWISLFLTLLGAIGILYTLWVWSQADFGPLENNYVSKTAILFGSLMALGVEAFLFTAFLRILNTRRTQK